MKKKKNFCSYCGEAVEQKEIEGRNRDFCPRCATVFYENPLPVASAIVVNERREVLLVKRKNEPYREMWCLPIGFAESGEEIRHAALRELKEESGVDGDIVRLIDVDTVENDYYGSLAIVTYEVRTTGGSVEPGDDALDAAYFPIQGLPPLAWSSNERAISKYIDIYRDAWTMVDSFRHLFPGAQPPEEMLAEEGEQYVFLSNVLVKLIERHLQTINDRWLAEIAQKLPPLAGHLDKLSAINRNILRGIQYWLGRGTDTLGVEEFIEAGNELRAMNVPFPEMLTAMALSRKSLWKQMVGERILSTPLEIYTALELNNRVIFFYDKINFFIAQGYMRTR